MANSSALEFTVRRKLAVLVPPAAPTPRELKRLSDIDDQDGLRYQVPIIHFFRQHDGRDDDPAPVLRGAIAAMLVHYYPFAGRLRELEGRKLAVDCTGEGVLFVEADADVRLDLFDAALGPPFPCLDELLFDVPGPSGILDCPLLLFQVTRLACGGFIMAVRIQHTMADGAGILQLMGAIAELARGAPAPTVQPVWGRELLQAPLLNDDVLLSSRFVHREYDDVMDMNGGIVPFEFMVHRSFFIGWREISAIRSHLPSALSREATNFEVITGCLWRCRTAALAPCADEEMRMICIVNIRFKSNTIIPVSYYGNAFASPVAISTAGNLLANPLSYAVELVMKAKREVDVEYILSVATLMAQRGRPHFAVARGYLVADVTKFGFRDLDFGWGKPVYAGPAKGGVLAIPGVASFFIAARNAMGEEGIAVPVCMPGPTMDKFVNEMGKLMRPALADTFSKM
ncbi:benzyl alcohol O-benzoyltransferase-like [Triticum urartu]|uniref:Benzyl alcohol O-benzoyltransferase n=1 Tax=Triticum urartu TaxID=4572 RepID=A0A8R7QVP4_TRIUA|nr:benzyl alcohol O-benzoyltransferase-like [Triticum urartu]